MSQLPLSLRCFRRVDAWVQHRRVELLRRRLAACGRDVAIQWPVVINGADHLHVGDRVSINAFVHIWAQGGVRIGADCLIASHVAITSLTHTLGARIYAESYEHRPIEIGRNVWIGTHATILPGVTIGDNAVIGAGAIVTRDVPPDSIAIGVPAVSRPKQAG